jgi:hypothetical protein
MLPTYMTKDKNVFNAYILMHYDKLDHGFFSRLIY